MEIIEIIKTCEICGKQTDMPLVVQKTGGNHVVRAYICEEENMEDTQKIITLVERTAFELGEKNE